MAYVPNNSKRYVLFIKLLKKGTKYTRNYICWEKLIRKKYYNRPKNILQIKQSFQERKMKNIATKTNLSIYIFKAKLSKIKFALPDISLVGIEVIKNFATSHLDKKFALSNQN